MRSKAPLSSTVMLIIAEPCLGFTLTTRVWALAIKKGEGEGGTSTKLPIWCRLELQPAGPGLHALNQAATTEPTRPVLSDLAFWIEAAVEVLHGRVEVDEGSPHIQTSRNLGTCDFAAVSLSSACCSRVASRFIEHVLPGFLDLNSNQAALAHAKPVTLNTLRQYFFGTSSNPTQTGSSRLFCRQSTHHQPVPLVAQYQLKPEAHQILTSIRRYKVSNSMTCG